LNGGSVNTVGGGNPDPDNDFGGYGSQVYSGPVFLGADTTLSASQVINVGNSPLDGGINFTVNSTLDSTVNNYFGLVANSDGNATFGGAVGANGAGSQLGFLTVNINSGATYPGEINLNGPVINTVGKGDTDGSDSFGDQTYNGSVVIGGNNSVTLEAAGNGSGSGGNISFSGPMSVENGASLLMTSAAGPVSGSSNIVSAANLTWLNAVSGILNINSSNDPSGAITTAGDQDYYLPVTFGQDTTLTSGNAVTFKGALDSAGSPSSLTVNPGSDSNATFGGVVGGNSPLNTLTVNGASNLAATSSFPTATIATSGSQTYNGAVAMGADQLLSSSGGNITFSGAVDSGSTQTGMGLLVKAGGNISFNGAVGANNPLGILYAAGSSINIGYSVTTAASSSGAMDNGYQSYAGPVTIGQNTTFATAVTLSASGGVDFFSTVDALGNSGLTVDSGAGQRVYFMDSVGGTTPLASLSVNTTHHGGIVFYNVAGQTSDVVTPGAQEYGGPVTAEIGSALLLSDTSITFDSTVSGPVLAFLGGHGRPQLQGLKASGLFSNSDALPYEAGTPDRDSSAIIDSPAGADLEGAQQPEEPGGSADQEDIKDKHTSLKKDPAAKPGAVPIRPS
jgi:hypothetical protein